MELLPWGTDSNLTDSQFFNRVDEINILTNLLNTTATSSPPSIMLSGFRGVGKTALLKKIKKELESDYLINYIDLTKSYHYQTDQLNEVNLMQFLYKTWIECSKEKGFNTTIEQIKKIIKTKNIKIENLLDFGGFPVPIPETKDNKSEIIDFVLDLPQRLYENHAKNIKGVITIIDEFQILKDLRKGLDGVLWLFRSFIQNQKNVAYIFSGSMNSKDEIIEKTAGKSGAFGGRMLSVEIHPFSKKTCEKYLNKKVPSLKFKDEGFNRFYSCTKGIPFYINTFAKILPKDYPLNDEDVKKEFTNALPFLADHLKQQWGRLKLFEQTILTLLVDKPLKRIEIAKKLNKSSNSLSRTLNSLLKTGFLVNDSGKYEIYEPIFKLWLKHEYEKNGVFPFKS
ncbi:MAG: ATP-binding protein [Methanobrevibacter sp.]|jgi:predicted transcriptional regulator|nr:ATP-binding protein [Candidatus Methanoflexus mossambicus]